MLSCENIFPNIEKTGPWNRYTAYEECAIEPKIEQRIFGNLEVYNVNRFKN